MYAPSTIAPTGRIRYPAPKVTNASISDANSLLAGKNVFAMACASCHGPEGRGGPKGGSIVDPSYLALVSDQGLRTTVMAGRPDLGMPDWRGYVTVVADADTHVDVTAATDVLAGATTIARGQTASFSLHAFDTLQLDFDAWWQGPALFHSLSLISTVARACTHAGKLREQMLIDRVRALGARGNS